MCSMKVINDNYGVRLTIVTTVTVNFKMSSLSRLIARQSCLRWANSNCKSVPVLVHVRSVKLISEPYKPTKVCDHDSHNQSLGRPMSPHLSIYKPQLTSLLSISHRISGAFLLGYMIMFGVSSFLPWNFETMLESIRPYLNTPLIIFIKLAIAFPLSYHFIAGVRHLVWDAGQMLTMKAVYASGYIMLLAFLSLVGFMVYI